MGFVQRHVIRAVIRVVCYPKTTVVVCAAVLVAAVVFAWFGLSLSTNQDELLTAKLPFFRDYQRFVERFPENESFVVVLEPHSYRPAPPAKRWIEFADRVSAKLSALKGDVRHVNARTPVEELGPWGLSLEPSEAAVRQSSAEMRRMLPLLKVLGEQPGLDSILLGSNMSVRFFRAMGQGQPEESVGFTTLVARSLGDALEAPGGGPGAVVGPNMAELDPGAATDPSRFGYNMISNELKRGDPVAHRAEKILAINVYPDRDYSSLADVVEPLARMRAVVEAEAKDFPEFRKPVITGRPALEADEMATSDRDTRFAEILGLSLVFIALLIFLRNLWLVVVAELCLMTGIGWTFGWAAIYPGRLNLLSLVFVIALIGIGMDYLIQILVRYRFEKKRYSRPTAIWARVFRYVSPPISTACLGAAGAFLASVMTDFQGAAELGVIAGGGLLLCLLTGYTLLPALLTLFPANVGEVPRSRRYRDREAHPRAGGWRLMPAVLWLAVAALGLMVSWPPRFDASLLKLQADGLESVREVRKLPAWYSVVLSEDLVQLRAAREAMLAGKESSRISHTESILDAMDHQAWLVKENEGALVVKWIDPAAPTVADLQTIADSVERLVTQWERALPEVARAKALPPMRAAAERLTRALRGNALSDAEKVRRVAAWQAAFRDELRRNAEQFTPPPVEVRKLPRDLRGHLADTAQPAPLYALYVYPREDLWEPGKLKEFVEEVEGRFGAMKSREGLTLTGIAPNLHHATEEIHGAFLESTLYALVLIFVLVLIDVRSISHTFLAISVLALGLPMLLLVMWGWRWLGPALGLPGDPLGIPGTWNFANFFALPILIGAGHEYGVFMVHRYREALHDPRRVWRTWDVSDRALLLCAIVTSCSFGFLVIAKHHGLQSLGWVMAVGTACIYLSTVLVLRPILVWRLKHKGVYYQDGDGNGKGDA